MRHVAAFALVSCVFLVYDNPATAQSHSGFEHARVSLTSVHHYVATDAVPRQLESPPNLYMSSVYRPLVESMLRASPTFRRQCMRISGEPRLTVRLTIGTGSPSEVRATTRLTWNDKGRLHAVVEILSRRDTEELIAHEIEHIIEQLDGVNLAARAALPHTGVTAIGPSGDTFETARAKRVGLKVVSELGR